MEQLFAEGDPLYEKRIVFGEWRNRKVGGEFEFVGRVVGGQVEFFSEVVLW